MNDQYLTNVLLKINAKVEFCIVIPFEFSCFLLFCLISLQAFMPYLILVILSHFPQLGGMNSLLSIEHAPSIPLVSKLPTLILGMDVSHGSPGHSDVPSIAAVINIFSAFLSAVPLVICA